MTLDQWQDIQTDISSLQLLVIALAKIHPNPVKLRAELSAQDDIFETALLNSEAPDELLKLHKAKILRMKQSIWG